MTPSSPRQRLERISADLKNVPGNDIPVRFAQTEAEIQCAVEITEALCGLQVAVNDLTNRSTTVINNLINRVEQATAQAKAASVESGKVAAESANLARGLNALTKWIVGVAVLSALAAMIQAGTAAYSVLHAGR